jgi:hypothetical protein
MGGAAGMLDRGDVAHQKQLLRLPLPTRRSRRRLGHVRDNIEVPTCRDEAVVFRAHKLGQADRSLDRTLKSRPHVGH